MALLVLTILVLCSLLVLIDAGSEGFTLGIRDSIMIAHSFNSEDFGPAQQLHGATYTVDVDLESKTLQKDVNWVIDIGELSTIVNT